jgi:hypothetical protein
MTVTINSLQINSSTPIAGLGTQTCNIVTAGTYTVQFSITIPFVQGTSANSTSTVGQSALQVVVNQNGTPLLTVGGSATNPTPTQPSLSGAIQILCAATDVITVVLTSANAVDAVPNAVKGIVNVFLGPI